MNIPFKPLFSSPYARQETIFASESLHPSVYSRSKRLVDIAGAIVGLLVTALLALPIAIAQALDSPGPIFYRQLRCGLNGETFFLWKFRSMVVDAEQKQHLVKNQAIGHIFKNDRDPRVTRVGRFLRRSSLDEFPQFWNVLKGEMSLVGTRPPTPDEVRKYNTYHFLRLRVKPGLTGEWQVKGRSRVSDFEEIVRMDLDYQHKWSLGYDLYLIWRTIGVVLSGRGAC
ncbi:sugar transferase [Pannus brasiliensis CCIBt3594]|uniref:Sugar transferase n=1 Tax=Pannus brasiliensis CCIBt3594 TaxID=1427578 RepID=A0AAW9QK42_9CHRO